MDSSPPSHQGRPSCACTPRPTTSRALGTVETAGLHCLTAPLPPLGSFQALVAYPRLALESLALTSAFLLQVSLCLLPAQSSFHTCPCDLLPVSPSPRSVLPTLLPSCLPRPAALRLLAARSALTLASLAFALGALGVECGAALLYLDCACGRAGPGEAAGAFFSSGPRVGSYSPWASWSRCQRSAPLVGCVPRERPTALLRDSQPRVPALGE